MPNISAGADRFRRLKSMDRHEFFDRARQFVSARLDFLRFAIGGEFGEVRRDDSSQAHGRFFFTPAEVPTLCDALKQFFPSQADEIVSTAENICLHRFDLLGYENLDYGSQIDWHLDVVHGKCGPRKPWYKVKYLDFREVGDAKITWELNRHQHFVILAKAFRFTGDEKFAREIFAQWSHWHKANPYPMGMNWASSLEVAYRSLSWIWTFFLLHESLFFTAELRGQWQEALNLSGRHIEKYLSTYFSPNTHLLGEALALFFIGTLFPGLPSSGRWRQRGWGILLNEAPKQVREGGFYFEQSTYYHVYALDIFLHARILAGLNGVEIPTGFDRIVERMLTALLLLGRAGVAPGIGDDDGGRLFDGKRNRAEHMLDPLATGAVLYRRGDFKFAARGAREETLWLLGLRGLKEFDLLPSDRPSADSTALLHSGLYLMADEELKAQLMIDAGPLGALSGGHGHADALSVSLVQDGHQLLIDPGTFEYAGTSGLRSTLRATAAHNTMQVDACDQAEQAGPFAWKSFPNVWVERWITAPHFDLFRGKQDGYSRLPSPVIHQRDVFHKKGEFWLVRDRAEGRGTHQLNIGWHVGACVSRDAVYKFRFANADEKLAIVATEDSGWSTSASESYCSPAYGRKESSRRINFAGNVELPADFAAVVVASVNRKVEIGRLVRLFGGTYNEVSGFSYSTSRQDHHFLFADGTKAWMFGTWASDAKFLYWSGDRERDQYCLILCSGSYAEAGGRRVVTCSTEVTYAEIVSCRGKVETFSSGPGNIVLEQPLEQVWAKAEAQKNVPKGIGV